MGRETRAMHWVSWSLQQFFGVIPLKRPQPLLVREWLIAALCCHPPKPHVWQGIGRVAAGFVVSREDDLGNGSAALPAAVSQLYPNTSRLPRRKDGSPCWHSPESKLMYLTSSSAFWLGLSAGLARVPLSWSIGRLHWKLLFLLALGSFCRHSLSYSLFDFTPLRGVCFYRSHILQLDPCFILILPEFRTCQTKRTCRDATLSHG